VGFSASLAGSITVLNRFIDYWLHIGLGVIVWLFRRRMDLHSWREVKTGHSTDSGHASKFFPARKGTSLESGFSSAFEGEIYGG